ncbi:MAG: hypothetical protein OER97_06295 [Gammaproteobacteria bacterium]|nr:hypothetical protein [Gammaproteobacteria bacterium]
MDKTILVVDQDRALAENLKELIEFMDQPYVVTAVPTNWRQRIGERRLEAVFVGPDLSDQDVSGLLADLKIFDPNVPVVMMQGKS